MNQADRVIAKFPSQVALAEKLGINQSAVAMWKKRGQIPVKYHQPLVMAASTMEVDLAPADFFEQRVA